MTRMTGPDCAVMCNLINTHTHTHTTHPFCFFPLPDPRLPPSLEDGVLVKVGHLCDIIAWEKEEVGVSVAVRCVGRVEIAGESGRDVGLGGVCVLPPPLSIVTRFQGCIIRRFAGLGGDVATDITVRSHQGPSCR